jgi:2-(1,2-epoxy-1,2-dihydrophenyl)acetyl-CoA isomerase
MAYVERLGPVLRCVVATAERGCTLRFDAVLETTRALTDPGDARAVLLVGTGPSFCTGGDVRAFSAGGDPAATVRELAVTLHQMLLALVRTPLPVVAAVQGWAAGAGMSLVCASDVPVAGDSTRLRPAYPAIGYSPDGGLTWTLPRIVGAGRARQILLGDLVLDAPAALAAGLVARVVPDAEVAATAEATARQLAAGPTAAYGRIKQLLRDSATAALEDQLEAEAAGIAASAAHQEGREGVAAFLDRRPPRFAGD